MTIRIRILKGYRIDCFHTFSCETLRFMKMQKWKWFWPPSGYHWNYCFVDGQLARKSPWEAWPWAAHSVAKLRKLGGEARLKSKIITSSKHWSYIPSTVFMLSNHWPRKKGMSFKGICAKVPEHGYYPLFFQSVYKSHWSWIKML